MDQQKQECWAITQVLISTPKFVKFNIFIEQ